jgi:hypothetical protein
MRRVCRLDQQHRAIDTLQSSSAEHGQSSATTKLQNQGVGICALHIKCVCNSAVCCRESVAINSSLMTLARCLEVLRYNQQHPADQKVIPYRESKV